MSTVIVKGDAVATDTRGQMVRATMALLQERGYAGTSFGDVMALSGAPRGSIYHHFPGGKQQLVAEAIELYSRGMLRRLSTAVESGPSTQVVRVLIDSVRDGLRASDFRAGCAVAAVTLDATPADGVLLGLTAEAFAAWRGVLAGAFRRDGATGARARRLAAFVVAAVEGAMMLARADRDVAPISDVAQELDIHIRSVLSEDRRPIGA